jgi:hypothetical protein
MFQINRWFKEITRECGLGGVDSWNRCVVDECESDKDCARPRPS